MGREGYGGVTKNVTEEAEGADNHSDQSHKYPDDPEPDPSHTGLNVNDCGASQKVLDETWSKWSYTDVICKLLIIVCFLGWLFSSLYSFSKGNPAHLMYPTNSEGQICGLGNLTGKPNLLYFDLTQCAGIPAAVGGCPTPQVCVAECPMTYWTSAQGKSSDLAQFCNNLSPGTNYPLSQLVAEKSCPAYLLPSRPVLGRCVPTFGLVRKEETGRVKHKMNAMKTADGEVLHMDSLIQGIKYLMEIIDARGHSEKLVFSLLVYWWIVMLSFLLALIMSLTCTVLINLAAKPVMWTTIVLCPPILVAGTVYSLMSYTLMSSAQENPNQDDISLPPVITSLSSYWINNNTWLVCGVIIAVITLIISILLVYFFSRVKLAIKLIEEASKAVSLMKTVLLFPLVQGVAQVLIIIWSLTVSTFLATTGAPEYRVVDACSSETCINTDTGQMFSLHDICDPQTFAECTGCPRAQCVYHKFVPASLGSWLQVWNLAGMVWLVLLVQSLGCLMVSAAVARMAGDLPSVGIWGRVRRSCRGQLGTLGCALPFQKCRKNGFTGARNRHLKFLSRITERLSVHLILFTAKLCIVGLVAAITFVTFSVQTSYLDNYLNYQFCLILIIILCVYCMISGFLNIYSTMIETLVNCKEEDIEQHGRRKDNLNFIISKLKTILEQGEKQVVKENPASLDVNENLSQTI